MITREDQKKLEDFYEFIDEIRNYTHRFDGNVDLKRDLLITFYGTVFEMFDQFDSEDLALIKILQKNHDEIYLSDTEKEVFINAINYAKSNSLSKKKKYSCYLKIHYSNAYLIYNTKIETNITIEAISQEYLKMSNEEYEDYICWTALDIFEKKANLIPLDELTGGKGIPGFTYEEIGNA